MFHLTNLFVIFVHIIQIHHKRGIGVLGYGILYSTMVVMLSYYSSNIIILIIIYSYVMNLVHHTPLGIAT